MLDEVDEDETFFSFDLIDDAIGPYFQALKFFQFTPELFACIRIFLKQ